MFPNDTTKQTIHSTKQKPNPFPNPSLKPISITSEPIREKQRREGGIEGSKKIIEGTIKERKTTHKLPLQPNKLIC